jgi:eukaryotic-like serine/threonine-protein kinase
MATKADSQTDSWSVVATSGLVPLAERPFEMPFVPGQIVAGKYEVIELVGVGGVGFVVAANHIELNEKIALKFLRPEMLTREDVVARFAQEALAAVRIKNEHVARVFDVGTLPNGCPFIVMEYLDGRDLYDIIVNDGPQPIKRAVDYVLQACEALADAHARGIVHRDVKPENLFLIRRSEGLELIKVLDFGISKVALTGSAFGSKVPLVRTMLPMGSPVYMSPEQIRASKDIDVRTDIWSMGCVLHEMLTGKPAFDAPSLTQLSATILEEHPPKLSEVCPGVPEELAAIVARCLEKAPERRFQNMAELALALYPFGTRRSRHSAERCCMLLRVDGTSHAEFELPSVRPPGWASLPSGAYPTTTQMRSSNAADVSAPDDLAATLTRHKPRRTALLIGIAAGVVAALVVAFGLLNRPRATANDAKGSFERRIAVAPPVPASAMAPLTAANKPTVSAPARNVSATLMNDAASPPSETTADVVKSPPVGGVPRPVYRATKARKKASTAHGNGTSNTDPDPGF